ncbi:alpha-glucuronidase family glycosyl hydrolase [Asticcacaulis sp. BYS171W]|uniref:Xylan alpha-1,2-glucuronidase n=1 Tax=Asticcacaulis aquaticus TaxID=2984212 RepID=A0ABT5HVX4_9CAUL|nr:alpha-glucuronidase family glycosyl hydrolase [Asticcacaulis aquaticus]MDC7684114.1 alpha-glucuronidase family glycosyl hydrolase [Asticcacaulis aquaticus]
MVVRAIWLCLLMLMTAGQAHAEDGYELWLRYRPVQSAVDLPQRVVLYDESPTGRAAASELQRGLSAMTGRTVSIDSPVKRGIAMNEDPAEARKKQIVLSRNAQPDPTLGAEGYHIETGAVENHVLVTRISANRDIGLLYGAFAYLRQVQTGQPVRDTTDAPRLKLRLLNHWDNLDGTVERGYAGSSLWDWWRLPDLKSPRYVDYARANASIGINGTVLNNVNARAESLTSPYIVKAAALADTFRPYGIRVYLSVRFSAPIELGGLKTADPLDPAVRAWWKAKADEIYAQIPDFGGFLVKANSEGQPGPQDYHRTHADGANMLAAALGDRGTVMWRAFVYKGEVAEDRHKQAYNEFTPLDGTFAPNVLVQVKNGAIDFQPREPFHPLFGAMPKTPLMMEFQITKEYLGFATHLAYLGQYYEETLSADTFERGQKGRTVAQVISGMAGVANIGTDRNWSGSNFDQANWYAFGRLAWNPHASARDIATEWARMTFTTDARFVRPVVDMMMRSRETVADYMTPLGLHHLMATGHHYGPGPWVDNLSRPDWNPVYYHKADKDGIGFDRTAKGSGALSQYDPLAQAAWANPQSMDERYLLWFHHLSWDYKTRSGRPLWDELVLTYDRGARDAAALQDIWAKMQPYIDAERFEAVSANLRIQAREAKGWRDASIAYFQSKSGRALPAGVAPPDHSLDYYKSLKFPFAPGI